MAALRAEGKRVILCGDLNVVSTHGLTGPEADAYSAEPPDSDAPCCRCTRHLL